MAAKDVKDTLVMTARARERNKSVARMAEEDVAKGMTLEERHADLLMFIERDNRMGKRDVPQLNENIVGLAFTQAGTLTENKALKQEVQDLKKSLNRMNDEINNLRKQKTVAPAMQQPTFAQVAQAKEDEVQTTIQKLKSAPKTTLFITSKKREDAKKVRKTFTREIEISSGQDAKKIMDNKSLRASLTVNPSNRGGR